MHKLFPWIIVILSCSLILILTACHPAFAENLHSNVYTPPTSLEPAEVTFQEDNEISEVLGYVNYINLVTSKQTEEEFIFETEEGNVQIKLTRTQNIMCDDGCPDKIEVYNIPEGYIAYPSFAEVPEGSSLQIKIFQYIGG